MPDNAPLRGADPRLQRRRPTSEELDKLSEITDADVDAAIDAFNRHAPAEAKGLLDATPITGE
jgi:hypothetical protein